MLEKRPCLLFIQKINLGNPKIYVKNFNQLFLKTVISFKIIENNYYKNCKFKGVYDNK